MTTCFAIIHANNNHNANADELTTDNAYISKLELASLKTGTAPFDNDDMAGNDSSETNDIVRTYDDVTATYKYSITTDDNSQYTSCRIGIRIELPYEQKIIDFNQDKMLWIDKTTGYEPKITTENINGVQTRVLTAYRMITGNGHNTVIPGSGNIDIVYHVNGAVNGQKITPKVSAWVVPNDKHNRMITAESQTFTVSAKPSYNILTVTNNIDVSKYDFSQFNNKAYDSYYNSDLGVRTGNIQRYNIGIEARWPTAEERANKGIKGLETTSGNMTFTITARSIIRDSSNKTIQMSNDDKAQIQPYLWNVSDHDVIRKRNSHISSAWNNRISEKVKVPFEGLTVNEQRNSDNTTYTVNVNTDRLYNSNYPEGGVTGSCGYFTDKKDGVCSNPGKIIIAEMGFIGIDVFNPIDYNDKTLITSKYPNAASVYSVANITDFHAISKSGIQINNETTNTDNSMSMSIKTSMSYVSSYQNYINFTCINYYQSQMGTDCWNWNSNGNYLRSTDIGLHDDKIRIILFNRITDNYQGNDEIIGLKLFKYNPDYFDFNFNNPHVNFDSKYLKTYYAVKPDGSKWSSNQELIKTHVKDLKYYDSYDEASSHGTVIAVLFQQTAKAHSFIFIDGKVKTTAPLGTYGLIGSETIEWSKYYLNDNGYNDDGKLDPYDETQNTAWRDYMSTIDWLNGYINDTGLKPLMIANMNSYKEPSYDENGKLLNGGNHAGGDAMFIVNEKNTVTRSTAQLVNNAGKTVYDLDNSERIIDYKINFTTVSSENNRHNANVYITDTIPAGLNYIDNSGYLDGSYKQNLPLQGIISGGSRINPKITKNDDGSTTLLFTVPNVYTDGSQHVINYSLKIGNENDPDNDVTNNSAFLTQSVIESTGNHAEKYKEGKTLSEFTVRINKNGTSSLSIMSMKPYVDISTDFTYNMSITNRAGVLNNPFIVIKLPANDTSDSENVNYHGSIKLTGFKSKQKLSSDAAFYYTADSKYGNMAVNKITRTDITDNWVKLAYDNDTGVIKMPSGGVKPLMLAYVDSSINEGQSNGFTVTVKPTDNESGDVYNTVISDGGVLTSSIVSVVSRTISGTAWFDANGNGIRNTDDKLLDKVKVSITDKNGKTLKDLTGKDLTTTTDGNGYYSFSNIPSGSDYQVRFINSNDNLNAMTATLKAAGSDATVQNQADAVMRTDDKTKLDYTVIMLPVLPSSDDMTSSSFILDNQNSGLTGELPYVDGAITKQLNQKLVNRNLTDSDAFKVSILPSNANSPADVIQNEVSFNRTDGMSRSVSINVGKLKPGSYSYKVSNVDTNIFGVKYDENWFTIRITIRNDYDDFKKTADVSMVKYDGSDAVNELSWINTFTGSSNMPMTGMSSILIVLIGLCLIACVHVVKHIMLVKYE